MLNYKLLFIIVYIIGSSLCITGCEQESSKQRVLVEMDLDEIFKNRDVRALAKYAAEGNIKKVDELIQKGVDINAKGALNATPLLISMDNVDGFRRLLERGADPNVKFNDKGTILHWLARMDAADQMELALQYGGDPNLIAGDFDHTPAFKTLQSPTKVEIPETLKLLIKYGANINQVDDFNSTLLIEAASLDRFDIVLYLLNIGADPNIKPIKGMDLEAVIEWRKSLLSENSQKLEELKKIETWLINNKEYKTN